MRQNQINFLNIHFINVCLLGKNVRKMSKDKANEIGDDDNRDSCGNNAVIVELKIDRG